VKANEGVVHGTEARTAAAAAESRGDRFDGMSCAFGLYLENDARALLLTNRWR
jgi:hypothetical protein